MSKIPPVLMHAASFATCAGSRMFWVMVKREKSLRSSGA